MTYGTVPSHTAHGPRLPGRRRLSRIALVAVMAGIALGAAACSSKAAAPTTTVAPSTTTTLDAAAAQSAISTSFNTLFNLSNPDLTSKLAVIQDGSSITTALQQALSSSLASSSAGSKIDSVQLLSTAACKKVPLPTPCAKVVYDINGPTGTAVLANSQGYAVDVNGTWLVAKTTICGLLGLFYQAEGNTGNPAGC